MKLQEGVDLHFLPSTQFTTNRIQFRFTAPLSEKTVAGRVLVANLLEVASRDYPNPQEFRRRLAYLYGADLSTSVNKIGQTHIVDVSISFVKNIFLSNNDDITKDILDFLSSVLLAPFTVKNGFSEALVAIEKRNLIRDLQAELEDPFYHADKQLDNLYFQEENMKLSELGRIDLVEKETVASVSKAYQEMLKFDKLDIFVLGEVNKDHLLKMLDKFRFKYRKPALSFFYRERQSNITREKIEARDVNQSILELGYSLQKDYTVVNYINSLVFNSFFGDSPYSRLFVRVREKEGLAYTIGSSLNFSEGFLRIYAGIEKKHRKRVFQLVQREIQKIKRGQISKEELERAKKGLIYAICLSQDSQSSLIEVVYQQSMFGKEWGDVESLIEAIQAVCIEDIKKVAQQLQLHAFYFTEGIAENA